MARKRDVYKSLNLGEKVQVIKLVESGAKKKSDVAKEFGIPASTLSTILKNKGKTLEAWNSNEISVTRKRLREPHFEDIEDCTIKWFKQARDNNIPISGPTLLTKAEEFSKILKVEDFKASSGWLHRFKERHELSFKKICGESASVSDSDVVHWQSKLPEIISDFEPKNVFNVDETGLFFKCMPDKTLTFKGETCSGGKRSKERITVLLGANMDGTEKLPALVIGKSANPRCFKNVKSLPVEYLSNSKAWMTGDIFEKWLLNLDKRMLRQKRKILLFVDNCTAHARIPKLKSVKVIFFPPNMTAKAQPMDQGVIYNFKQFYRKQVVSRTLEFIEKKQDIQPVNLLEAVRMIRFSWTQVTENTIKNCFRKAGFFITSDNTTPEEVSNSEDIPGWENFNSPVSFKEYVELDNSVVICGALNEADIVASFQENASSDEEIETEGDSDVTTNNAKSALLILQKYFEQQNKSNDEIFDCLNKLHLEINSKKMSKQMKITNFFM